MKITAGFTMMVAALALGGCSPAAQVPAQAQPQASSAQDDSAPLPDQRASAVHFLQPVFSVLDCEKKGEVEAGEVDNHFFELYFFADRDQSRSISQAEFLAHSSAESRDKDLYVFQQMDTNRNGTVSVMEYRQHVFRALELADTDADGVVTAEEAELAAFLRARSRP
ncbi:MAG: hypothetical protein CML06_06150 [Pseudomonadales bacterium]|nr:hypothetical protein [Pseudomonadales bacterium]